VKNTPTARAVSESAAVWLPVGALRPNPRNPRAHGAEVARLARTIVRTTWGAPIIAQASTHRIIGGHGRLDAAKLILAGIEVDGIARGGADHLFDRSAPGPGLVPVRLVDVSDAEADAMTLADNATALQGRDDAAALVAMATAAFERDAPTMADMGYGARELDALVKAAGDAVLAAAPTTGAAVTDHDAEWEGMPEFESNDEMPHRSITVHFRNDADVVDFLNRLELEGVSSKAKFTWFPYLVRNDFASKAYVSDGEQGAP
jgi:hypothetical protein